MDDSGVMVMATALFLERDVEVYSGREGGGTTITRIEGGEGAGGKQPLTVFYFRKHYQSVYKKD